MSSSSASSSSASVSSTVSSSASSSSSSTSTTPSTGVPSSTKYTKRKSYQHQGRTIYTWEQDIEQLDMWITPPPGVTAKMVECVITEKHLKLGLKGNPPFIDEDFHATVIVSESFWMMEDGELHINLQKSSLAETWPSVLKGHSTLSSVEQEQETQKIMLERFGREHPGFDFSQATFSGQTPDPKKFLGGFETDKIKGRG